MKKHLFRLTAGLVLILLWVFLFLLRTPSERQYLGPTIIIFLFVLLAAGITQTGIVLKKTLGKKLDNILQGQGKQGKYTEAGDEAEPYQETTEEEIDNLREQYRHFNQEQLQKIINAPRGEYLPAAVKIAREELENRKNTESDDREQIKYKLPVCSNCGQDLERDRDLDQHACKRIIDRTLLDVSGGLYLGTVCRECGKVECYTCRGGVGLPCSACHGKVTPAYDKLFRK
jgi:hypothetical protein